MMQVDAPACLLFFCLCSEKSKKLCFQKYNAVVELLHVNFSLVFYHVFVYTHNVAMLVLNTVIICFILEVLFPFDTFIEDCYSASFPPPLKKKKKKKPVISQSHNLQV